jgi:Xaa-Pro dipeptidase
MRCAVNVVEKIKDVQKRLQAEGIDGWLLYDFHKINPFAYEFLSLSATQVLTRRFFYWIPKNGEPIKLVHQIEAYALDHLPGLKKCYHKWQTLEELLKEILKKCKNVAMEYSPRNAVPYLSKVDGGVIDLVRECGPKIVSSGIFLQYYTAVLDEAQLMSHLFAAELLNKIASDVWHFIAEHLKKGRAVTEYDVQQYMMREFKAHHCVTDHAPNCSVNAHSALPHYTPAAQGASPIQKGDFILIDLWCKQKAERAVFADITRVAVAAEKPTLKQKEIFTLVRNAQAAATDFIARNYAEGKTILGCEVDDVARDVIARAGYEDFFTHRTGHNIYTDLHGPGTHLDNLETHDDRPLLAGTCCSIEPGIYFPGEFGIRLEYDLYLAEHGKIIVTGGVEEEITTLL